MSDENKDRTFASIGKGFCLGAFAMTVGAPLIAIAYLSVTEGFSLDLLYNIVKDIPETALESISTGGAVGACAGVLVGEPIRWAYQTAKRHFRPGS